MSFSSSSGTSVPGLSIKKFESQDEVDEKKRKRQEEWDKVRKPEDPLECPEEPSDNRCLYDRLEEQRLKKQEEFEEQVAFRNQVKRLDEDEVEFLDFVSERQQDLTREKKKEEADIISEMKIFRSYEPRRTGVDQLGEEVKEELTKFERHLISIQDHVTIHGKDAQVVKLTESKTEEKKSNKPVQQTTTTKKSQSALLAGAVKRKGSEESSTSKKSKLATSEVQSSQDLQTAGNSSNDMVKLTSTNDDVGTESRSAGDSAGTSQSNGVAKVVAILPSVLPGMNQYDDSSDSMSSSSDSEPDFNIGGRNFTFVNKIQQSR